MTDKFYSVKSSEVKRRIDILRANNSLTAADISFLKSLPVSANYSVDRVFGLYGLVSGVSAHHKHRISYSTIEELIDSEGISDNCSIGLDAEQFRLYNAIKSRS